MKQLIFNFQFSNELCKLLGYILVFCFPSNGNAIWDKYKQFLFNPKEKVIVNEQIALKKIEDVLINHGYTLGNFGLPRVNEIIVTDNIENIDTMT